MFWLPWILYHFSKEMDFGGGMIGHWDSWSSVSVWKPWKLVTTNRSTWHAIINHQSWSCQYSFGSPLPRWIGVLSSFPWDYQLYFRSTKIPYLFFTFKSSIVPNQVYLKYYKYCIVTNHLSRQHNWISSSKIATSEVTCCCWRNLPWSMNLLEKLHVKVGKTSETPRDGSGSVWDVWDILGMVSLDRLFLVLTAIYIYNYIYIYICWILPPPCKGFNTYLNTQKDQQNYWPQIKPAHPAPSSNLSS